MEVLMQEILHNHAAVLILLNHFSFELLSSHIMQVYIFVYSKEETKKNYKFTVTLTFMLEQFSNCFIFIKLTIFILFLLSSTAEFFLHCMLNILRYEKTFCKIDESIASQYDPSSDMIFLSVHSESIFPFIKYFFPQENCVYFCLFVSCLSLSQSAQILLVNQQ